MKGFTLIEMLVVIAITSVVGLTLSGSIAYFYKSNAYLLEQTAALDNARRGVTDAVRVIRETSYGDDGAYPIANASIDTITFFADLDNDNSVEKVTYRLVSSVLYRDVTNSAGLPPSYVGQTPTTSTIAEYVRNDVTSPLFTYYDVGGVQLPAVNTDEAKIASVSINLLVDLNPLRAPNVFSLTEKATLRNLRSQ